MQVESHLEKKITLVKPQSQNHHRQKKNVARHRARPSQSPRPALLIVRKLHTAHDHFHQLSLRARIILKEKGVQYAYHVVIGFTEYVCPNLVLVVGVGERESGKTA